MAVAMDHIFVGGQFPQTHRATGVELLGRDAHFTAQAEFSAVGEPGGGIDIDGCTVHTGGEDLLGIRIGDSGIRLW